MPRYDYYDINPVTGCHEWNHFRNPDGYAQNFYGSVARQIWKLTHGDIPRDWTIDHLCRNRCCVNIAHLEAVPHSENVRRGELWKVQGLKTHCPKNHPYDEDNTRLYGGKRHCRECDRARRIQK